MTRLSDVVSLVLGLGLGAGAAGCNSAIDVTAQRGALSFHFTGDGCGVSYTGDHGRGPVAVDLTCPVTLRAPHGEPLLHLSTPLAETARTIPLQDPHFDQPAFPLGQFVVVSYQDGDQRITCDPLMAQGAILYDSIPAPGQPDRLSGHFSGDAALLHCYAADTMVPSAGPPLRLSGDFDVFPPPR